MAVERRFASAFGSVIPEEGFATFLRATISSAVNDSLELFALPERLFYRWLTREAERIVTQVAIRQRPLDDYVRQARESLRQEPVLDGIDHRGEAVLRDAFARNPAAARRWVVALACDPSQPSFTADVLRLLCRIRPVSADWRCTIVEAALRSPFAEVRDAAIQAVESWADPELVPALRSHSESDRFLADYAAQVLRDLGER